MFATCLREEKKRNRHQVIFLGFVRGRGRERKTEEKVDRLHCNSAITVVEYRECKVVERRQYTRLLFVQLRRWPINESHWLIE